MFVQYCTVIFKFSLILFGVDNKYFSYYFSLVWSVSYFGDLGMQETLMQQEMLHAVGYFCSSCVITPETK